MTAQEAVLVEVRRALLDGTLPPGARINVDRMATELNVSRAPVRDALRILEGEGQVEYTPHRGYQVPAPAPHDLFDIYRMRELLETEALLLGAERIDDDVVRTMEEAADEVTAAVEARDNVAGTYANHRFHLALLETCGRPRLIRTIRHLWLSDAYRTVYFGDPVQTDVSNRQHYEIIEAARRRDADELLLLCNAHRDHALQMVLTALEAQGELPDGELPGEDAWRPRTITRLGAAT